VLSSSSLISTNLKKMIRAHELPAKLLNYFLRSDKSNINQLSAPDPLQALVTRAWLGASRRPHPWRVSSTLLLAPLAVVLSCSTFRLHAKCALCYGRGLMIRRKRKPEDSTGRLGFECDVRLMSTTGLCQWACLVRLGQAGLVSSRPTFFLH